jgi:hypothetical protein
VLALLDADGLGGKLYGFDDDDLSTNALHTCTVFSLVREKRLLYQIVSMNLGQNMNDLAYF